MTKEPNFDVHDGEKNFNAIMNNIEKLDPSFQIPVIQVPSHVRLDPNAIPIRYKDYPHDLYNLHKERRVGDFEIRKLTIPIGKTLQHYTSELGMCRCRFKTPFPTVQLHQIVQDGRVLDVQDGVWMSDTPMEFETTKNAVNNSKGDVLECGIGIGMFVHYASKRDEVKSITIVEQEKDVVDLVYPVVKNKKTNTIIGDAIEFLKNTDKKFDFIHIDIWASVTTPYLEIDKVLKIARKKLKPKGIVSCWLEENAENVKKKIKKGIKNGTIKQSKGDLIVNGEPCGSCGKTTRFDFGGLCMDCADDMGLTDFAKKYLKGN